MKNSYTIEGMTCNGCKAAVEKALSEVTTVKNVSVSLENKEAIIESDKGLSLLTLQNALSDKYEISEKKLDKVKVASTFVEKEESKVKQLFPLFLIFGYIIVTSFLLNQSSWNTNEFMLDFMGLFYIIFSFFKFLDVKGFAMSFQMYDPLAKKVKAYGLIYPFIELALGLLFLFRYQIQIALVLTLIVLGVTTIGVTKSLLDKKAIKCACLGSVLNLPMTTATFIENSIMIVMAVYMLIT